MPTTFLTHDNQGKDYMTSLALAALRVAGAQIIRLPFASEVDQSEADEWSQQHSVSYFRDFAFWITDQNKKPIFITSDKFNETQKKLVKEMIVRISVATEKLQVMNLPCYFEGGNVFFLPKQRIVLHGNDPIGHYGHNKYDISRTAKETTGVLRENFSSLNLPVVGIEFNLDFSIKRGESYEIHQSVYHLDCFMQVMPDGRLLIVNAKILSEETRETLEQALGDDFIDLAYERYLDEPCLLNFVVIDHESETRIVVEHLPQVIIDRLSSLGYVVITTEAMNPYAQGFIPDYAEKVCNLMKAQGFSCTTKTLLLPLEFAEVDNVGKYGFLIGALPIFSQSASVGIHCMTLEIINSAGALAEEYREDIWTRDLALKRSTQSDTSFGILLNKIFLEAPDSDSGEILIAFASLILKKYYLSYVDQVVILEFFLKQEAMLYLAGEFLSRLDPKLTLLVLDYLLKKETLSYESIDKVGINTFIFGFQRIAGGENSQHPSFEALLKCKGKLLWEIRCYDKRLFSNLDPKLFSMWLMNLPLHELADFELIDLASDVTKDDKLSEVDYRKLLNHIFKSFIAKENHINSMRILCYSKFFTFLEMASCYEGPFLKGQPAKRSLDFIWRYYASSVENIVEALPYISKGSEDIFWRLAVERFSQQPNGLASLMRRIPEPYQDAFWGKVLACLNLYKDDEVRHLARQAPKSYQPRILEALAARLSAAEGESIPPPTPTCNF